MKKLALLLIVLFTIYGMSHAGDSNKNVREQTWSKNDSKAYARDMLLTWSDKQFNCLVKLWGKESSWDSKAYNKVKVMGKNAGGIPQLLGMSPSTKPTYQIERGLAYIYYKYQTPCNAWLHHKKKGWY